MKPEPKSAPEKIRPDPPLLVLLTAIKIHRHCNAKQTQTHFNSNNASFILHSMGGLLNVEFRSFDQ
jgi:hypothetical protein